MPAILSQRATKYTDQEEAMMSRFRIVVAGCGAMADAWIDAAKNVPDAQVVGLVDIHRAAADAKAVKFDLPATVVFDSLTDAIAKTDANLVFDVTTPEAHETIVTQAIEAGCDVLGEKPLSTSVESAQRMISLAKTRGKTYAVMQNRRWLPEIIALRNTLDAGKLGRVEELHADMFVGAHFGGFRNTMEYPLLRDMAIHTFDMARYISRADPVSVYCHSWNPPRSWYAHHASAVCIFEMTNGVIFSYRGSWCADGLHADWNAEWRVIGANGSAKWDGLKSLHVQAKKADGKKSFFHEMENVPVELPVVEFSGHRMLIEDYFTCLRERRQPQTVGSDNIKSLAMVEAAVTSAETGAKVRVEW